MLPTLGAEIGGHRRCGDCPQWWVYLLVGTDNMVGVGDIGCIQRGEGVLWWMRTVGCVPIVVGTDDGGGTHD